NPFNPDAELPDQSVLFRLSQYSRGRKVKARVLQKRLCLSRVITNVIERAAANRTELAYRCRYTGTTYIR
ncbi:hypothetical protein JYU34_009845, partial [Plutella xylostella]